MTLLTGESMFAAERLEICKLSGVALTTFDRLQSLRCDRIETCVNLRQLGYRSQGTTWLGEPNQGGNKNQGINGGISLAIKHRLISSF
jgi:hypothetical protein